MAELSLLVKATIVLALTLAAGRLLPRARASVRSLLLASAFGVLLLLPLAAAIIPPRAVALPAAAIDLSALVMEPAPADIATTSARLTVAQEQSIGTRFQLPSVTAMARIAWAAGALVFAAPMFVALWRLRCLRRDALPWLAGRPLSDEIARQTGVTRSVEVFVHEALAAPMTCGLFRPAVGLPIDAPNWTEVDLRHALVHEMEHLRRRDWPVHLMARLVCALYWFHPLAWIAWRQLSLESERACDDAVLRDADGTAYAEQLVTLARRLSKHSPVPMLSMADRSNLSTRVSAVLDTDMARGRAGVIAASIIVLAAIVLTATLSPLQAVTRPPNDAGGQATPTQAAPQVMRFEVASIKRNISGDPSRARLEPGGRFTATSVPLFQLITQAYGVLGFQVVNAPDWVTAERFDVLAKTPEGVSFTPQTPLPAFMRGLLADRFAFQAHLESREMPIYELVLARNDRALGPKISQAAADCSAPGAAGPPVAPGSPGAECALLGRPTAGNGRAYRMAGFPMSRFAEMLGGAVERKVVDKTGLSGAWTLDLEFTPDAQADSPGNSPSIFTAVQEQLGLRLQPARGPVDVLVIDRVERPTPDDAPAVQPQAAAPVAFEVASIKPNPALSGIIGGRCQGTNVDPNAAGPIAALATAAGVAPLSPGRCRFTRVTLKQLITYAFGIPPAEADRTIMDGPGWLDERRFDVEAKADQPRPEADMKRMLQALLADRFGLRVRRETRDTPGFALVVGNSGPKLRPAAGTEPRKGINQFGAGPLTGQNATVAELARVLSMRLGRVVEDATGLTGRYNFSLHWTPGPEERAPLGLDTRNLPPEIREKLQSGADSSGTVLTTALQEQLGLRLQSRRVAADLLVIERAEPPTAN